MASVTEAAPAKVNLFLHVVGRRADGFHLLDSLAVFPSVGDFLHAHDDTDLSLSVTGPFAAKLAGEADNLVLRAARTLAESVGTPARARLVLEKRLPVASGIGGGSADAAASLRALSRLWRVPVPEKLAARLGADVPVCLESRPMRMGGVGEILRDPPALPSGGLVLVNPGLSVATPSVFAARAGSGAAFSAPARVPPGWRDAEELAAWLSRVGNDLEAPAIGLCPAIADVLAALRAQPGCLLARMSGSGATCFGLFAAAAEAARTAIRLETPGWWVWGGAMAGAGPHVPGVAEPAREAVHDAARWGVAKRQGSGF